MFRAGTIVMFLALCVLGCYGSSKPVEEEAPTVDDCGYPVQVVPAGCDSCHGAPPDTGRHPPNHRCQRCHGEVIDAAYHFVRPERHQDGKVEYAVGCTSCHGWNQDTAPPQSLTGECTVGVPGTGMHKAMRRDPIPAHRVNCSNCHAVPTGIWDPGHIDGDGKAEVVFANLATLHGATPVFDGETCSGVYCHGATLQGGDHKTPGWFDTSGRAGRCGACHRLTDPEGNPDADCNACHPTTLTRERELLPFGTHLNGVIDLPEGYGGKGGRR